MSAHRVEEYRFDRALVESDLQILRSVMQERRPVDPEASVYELHTDNGQ